MLLKIIKYCLFTCCILFSMHAMANTWLTALQLLNKGETVEISMDLNDDFDYKAFMLHNPLRMVVDLPNTEMATALPQTLPENSVVQTIRTSRDPQKLRVVIDLVQSVRIHIYRRPHVLARGNNFIIELAGAGPTHEVMKTTQKPIPVESVKPVKTPTPIQPRPIQASKPEIPSTPINTPPKNHPITIVIDAGHGGHDPGAKGPHGMTEKQVVLAIANQLKNLLLQVPSVRVVMTRKGDYYVALRQRLNIARRNHGDIFIAIHADAYLKKSSNGASVFALSQHGASSEAARWLAERENHSELGESSISDKSYMLRMVLIDLSQTATIADSLTLGNNVLQNLGLMTRLHTSKVEQAGFVVLKSPDMPSILVETGFISNPQEEYRLSDPQYQQSLARAIYAGISRYFEKRQTI